LSATNLIIGKGGTGTLNQSGGTTNAGILTLGEQSTGIGTYNLTGGTFTATTIIVGSAGQATFTQNGDTVSGNSLAVCDLYDLQSGNLTATSTTVGVGGNFKVVFCRSQVASRVVLNHNLAYHLEEYP
jgi:hypothetical protein